MRELMIDKIANYGRFDEQFRLTTDRSWDGDKYADYLRMLDDVALLETFLTHRENTRDTPYEIYI